MKRFFATLLLVVLASPAIAQQRDPAVEFTRANPKFLSAFRGAVARPSVSTVRVQCNGADTALGVIVGPDGWILTKANDLHGVISVHFKDGKTYDAELVGVHTPHDLALLKIEAHSLIPVEFRETKNAEVGAWIACVGPSQDPVAIGVISVASREIQNKGPAIDLRKTPYMGIGLEGVSGVGVKITAVMPGTPADRNGIKANDIVLKLGDRSPDTVEAFQAELARHRPGDVVVFRFRRGKDEFDKSIKLERRQAGKDRGDMQNNLGSELSTRRSGYANILQHDSVVRPSDCGGPIVDLDGKVLGINVCRAGRVESWAVPSEAIQPLLLELMSGKLAPPERTLSPDEKLAAARATLARVERDKERFDKDIEAARKALAKAQTEARDFKVNGAKSATEKVLSLMNERLKLMTDVAGWKWNHRVEIKDDDREAKSLARILDRAKDNGIHPVVVERFFKAQFEAARALQQERIAEWQKDNLSAPVKGDLAKDLRPRLDSLNDELLDALIALHGFWKDPELAIASQLRNRAGSMLAGMSDDTRKKAVGGFFVP